MLREALTMWFWGIQTRGLFFTWLTLISPFIFYQTLKIKHCWAYIASTSNRGVLFCLIFDSFLVCQYKYVIRDRVLLFWQLIIVSIITGDVGVGKELWYTVPLFFVLFIGVVLNYFLQVCVWSIWKLILSSGMWCNAKNPLPLLSVVRFKCAKRPADELAGTGWGDCGG